MRRSEKAPGTLTIVSHPPHKVWLAEKGDIPGLSDPDAGRKPRWHDRDSLDWDAIGDAVQSIGMRFLAGDFPPDEAGDCPMRVNIESYGFAENESEAVASWFWSGGPYGDPGITSPTNGCHRLWNVWKHNPRALLLINSDVLVAPVSKSRALRVLRLAPAHVLDRSPRYRDALREAAA